MLPQKTAGAFALILLPLEGSNLKKEGEAHAMQTP